MMIPELFGASALPEDPAEALPVPELSAGDPAGVPAAEFPAEVLPVPPEEEGSA